MGMRAWDRELTGGETHSTRGRRVQHDVMATREQGANGTNTDGVRGARSDSDLACIVWSI